MANADAKLVGDQKEASRVGRMLKVVGDTLTGVPVRIAKSIALQVVCYWLYEEKSGEIKEFNQYWWLPLAATIGLTMVGDGAKASIAYSDEEKERTRKALGETLSKQGCDLNDQEVQGQLNEMVKNGASQKAKDAFISFGLGAFGLWGATNKTLGIETYATTIAPSFFVDLGGGAVQAAAKMYDAMMTEGMRSRKFVESSSSFLASGTTAVAVGRSLIYGANPALLAVSVAANTLQSLVTLYYTWRDCNASKNEALLDAEEGGAGYDSTHLGSASSRNGYTPVSTDSSASVHIAPSMSMSGSSAHS